MPPGMSAVESLSVDTPEAPRRPRHLQGRNRMPVPETTLLHERIQKAKHE